MTPDLHLGMAALIEALDLPDFDTRDELIALLQERRALQEDALAARLPDAIPTASAVRLRATQRAEIQLCEDALSQLGAPLVAPNLEEERHDR